MVRIKQRYLLLNILYPDSTSKTAPGTPDLLRFRAPTPQYVNPQVFIAYLKTQIASLFGDQGLGLCLSSLKLVYFSNATSTAILRVPRAHYQIVWATLSFMTELPPPRGRPSTGQNCVMRVVRVSGTIRKAEEELLRRSRKDIAQANLAGLDTQNVVLSRLIGEGGDSSVSLSNERDPTSTLEDIADESDSD